MLIRPSAFICKFAPFSAAAVLLLAGGISAFAEEPVQKQEPAKKTEGAPEKKNLLNYRAYRPADSVFKSSSINLPTPTIPTAPAPIPHTSRKDLELLDREKNWIFVLPGDEKKRDSASEEIFGTDKTFDSGEPKSVITRFLEHQSSVESKSNDANLDGIKKDSFRATPTFGLNNQRQNGLGTLTRSAMPSENLIDGRNEHLTLAERWQELHGPRAEKMREEKRVQMNEFENLFSSQSIANGNGFGLQNNLNSPAGTSSSIELNPYTRNTPSGPTAFRNPVRSDPANVSPLPNINTRVFGSPAVTLPTSEPIRRTSQPAILPIPKRHF
jgi:hypothetical protein